MQRSADARKIDISFFIRQVAAVEELVNGVVFGQKLMFGADRSLRQRWSIGL